MGYLTESNQYASLKNAVAEAERFIRLAEEAIKELEADDENDWHKASYMEVAAAKRASMDLTRLLSVVRKGDSL